MLNANTVLFLHAHVVDLLQDIVTECDGFDMAAFMPLLQERILTRNPFARQFIVAWVKTIFIFLV